MCSKEDVPFEAFGRHRGPGREGSASIQRVCARGVAGARIPGRVRRPKVGEPVVRPKLQQIERGKIGRHAGGSSARAEAIIPYRRGSRNHREHFPPGRHDSRVLKAGSRRRPRGRAAHSASRAGTPLFVKGPVQARGGAGESSSRSSRSRATRPGGGGAAPRSAVSSRDDSDRSPWGGMPWG